MTDEVKDLVVSEPRDLAVQEKNAEALTLLAKGVNEIASFVTGGGLVQLLSGYARSQSVKDILGGLAAHSGRQALDARVLRQNALEIVTAIEKVFEAYEGKLKDKEVTDPEIKDAEADYLKWKEQNK